MPKSLTHAEECRIPQETSKTNFLTHTAKSGKAKHGIQTSGLPNSHSLPLEALKLTGREGKRAGKGS